MVKSLKHFITITKHRHLVMKYCFKMGIFKQGLLHDLSKYSFTEFFEGVKYYSGTHSPIKDCKKEKGYSKAWLHHKGRNKHHFEYWYDFNAPDKTPVIPYKYLVELICDNLAASITYMDKNWTPESQLEYFKNRKDLIYLNKDIKKLLIDVYEQIIKDGIDKTISKENLKYKYNKYVK